MAQTRARIGLQLEKSVNPGSLIRTNASNEQEYVAPGTAGQVLQIVGGVPTWTTPVAVGNLFSITDGATTQVIAANDTMTFTAGNGLNVAVSATDTVNYDVKLSADSGNALSFGTDNGLFYDAPNVVTGASWSDATNSLTLTFTEGVNVVVPIVDSIANFFNTFNFSDGTNTTAVTNGDTVTFGNTGNVVSDVVIATDAVTVAINEVEDTFDGLTSGTDVTLTSTPVAGAVLKVFRNGMKQVLGATADYTVSGTTITFNTAFGLSGGAAGSEVVEVVYFA
jgi:hypothetical protein